MEMVRDDGAASSTQRTITARDVDRRWQWHTVAPVMVAALPADRAENHLDLWLPGSGRAQLGARDDAELGV
jgi:hypothetical protein